LLLTIPGSSSSFNVGKDGYNIEIPLDGKMTIVFKTGLLSGPVSELPVLWNSDQKKNII